MLRGENQVWKGTRVKSQSQRARTKIKTKTKTKTKPKSLHAQPGPQKLSSSGQSLSRTGVKSHRSSTPSAPVLVPIIVCLPLLLYLLRALLPLLCQQG